MATYELSKEQYNELMKKLNPYPTNPTYESRGNLMSYQDFDGYYSQSYICRGENSREAGENVQRAVATNGKEGDPVASAKIYSTEFGVTTKVEISTEDEKVMEELEGMGIKPRKEKDYSAFVDSMVKAMHEAANDPGFHQYLDGETGARERIRGAFAEMAEKVMSPEPKKAKAK